MNRDIHFDKTALTGNHANEPCRHKKERSSAKKCHQFFRTAIAYGIAWVMTMVVWTSFGNVALAGISMYSITKDTRIDSDRTAENYGDGSLKMIMNSADHYGGSYVRVLIDLPDASYPTISAAVADDMLSSVKLWMNFWWISLAPGETLEDRGIVAHPLMQDFTEFGATFMTYDGTHVWTSPGGDYDPSISIEWSPLEEEQLSGWYSFDLTSLYASGYDLSDGLILMIDPETRPTTPNSWCTYCADNSEGTGPYLEVATVPEPGSCMLLVTGLIGGILPIYRRGSFVSRPNCD